MSLGCDADVHQRPAERSASSLLLPRCLISSASVFTDGFILATETAALDRAFYQGALVRRELNIHGITVDGRARCVNSRSRRDRQETAIVIGRS
ncbi:MAG: hypothetical protein DMF99_30760 [Acidobacteria bacterium]|nr:MAG: hypothetical protein DMF99_30760 [Acidobacteriota bacterium]